MYQGNWKRKLKSIYILHESPIYAFVMENGLLCVAQNQFLSIWHEVCNPLHDAHFYYLGDVSQG